MAVLKGGTYVGGDLTVANTVYGATASVAGTVSAGYVTINNDQANINNGSSGATMELRSSGNVPVGISFHRPGYFASKLIFGTDNKFHFGGWSDSADGGTIVAGAVYGAVWNDIADYIEIDEKFDIEYGKVYIRKKDGSHAASTKYCEKGIIGIASDTAGFHVGKKDNEKKEIPIAIGGFVLAYIDKVYEPGTALTTGRNGKLTKMKLWSKILYPERMIGIFYKEEKASEWGTKDRMIQVNGRHWVKVRG